MSVKWKRVAIKTTSAFFGFCATVFLSFFGGIILAFFTYDLFPPDIGSPSTDLRGRGEQGSADVIGINVFASLIFGFVGAWISVLLTDRENWKLDLLFSAPIFLIFSIVCCANYFAQDQLITRDAQAALNLPLAVSGLTVSIFLQKSLLKTQLMIIRFSGMILLAISYFAFVAIPLWYTLSYLSWKFGAGELESLDTAAKAVGAVASIIAVLGVKWKNGSMRFQQLNEENTEI